MKSWPIRVIFDYVSKVKDEDRVECIKDHSRCVSRYMDSRYMDNEYRHIGSVGMTPLERKIAVFMLDMGVR